MDHRAEILAKIFDVILSWPDEENETARDVDGDTGRQVEAAGTDSSFAIVPENGKEEEAEPLKNKNLKTPI